MGRFSIRHPLETVLVHHVVPFVFVDFESEKNKQRSLIVYQLQREHRFFCSRLHGCDRFIVLNGLIFSNIPYFILCSSPMNFIGDHVSAKDELDLIAIASLPAFDASVQSSEQERHTNDAVLKQHSFFSTYRTSSKNAAKRAAKQSQTISLKVQRSADAKAASSAIEERERCQKEKEAAALQYWLDEAQEDLELAKAGKYKMVGKAFLTKENDVWTRYSTIRKTSDSDDISSPWKQILCEAGRTRLHGIGCVPSYILDLTPEGFKKYCMPTRDHEGEKTIQTKLEAQCKLGYMGYVERNKHISQGGDHGSLTSKDDFIKTAWIIKNCHLTAKDIPFCECKNPHFNPKHSKEGERKCLKMKQKIVQTVGKASLGCGYFACPNLGMENNPKTAQTRKKACNGFHWYSSVVLEKASEASFLEAFE
jgi:hypothetical protein